MAGRFLTPVAFRHLDAEVADLAAVMLIAAITGFGRTYEAEDGSETKVAPESLVG